MTALHSTSSADQLDQWVERYEITHPVAGDFDRAILDLYTERPGRPQYAIVNRDFQLVVVGLNRTAAFERIEELLQTP